MRGSTCMTAKLVSGALVGDALGELDALGEARAVLDQEMRQADGLAFLGAVGAARSASAPSSATRRSAAAAAPSRRRRQRCRGFPPAARNRPSARRRGCGTPPQAQARRRPPRRAAPRPPAPCRTGSCRTRDATSANAATPSAMLRSVNSPRSRPAEKCSPAPCITTALMSFGSAWKKASMPRMVVSSSALRFCGRDSRRIAMLPRRFAVSEGGSLGANGFLDGFGHSPTHAGSNRAGQAGLKHLEHLDPHRLLLAGAIADGEDAVEPGAAGSAVSNRMKVRK